MSKNKKRKTLKPSRKFRRMRRRQPGSGNCSGLLYRGNGYHPNPFACDHAKWKNLTAGEADQLLASLPRERLGILERELNEEQRRRAEHGIARAIGRGLEDVTRQIGHSIDGGIS